MVVPSAYREFFGPLLDYLAGVAGEKPERPIAVIVPELVERRWDHVLLSHRATLLKELLILGGGRQIMIMNTPLYLRD
ncbi:MAG TPA: hypothetical protein VEI28_05465 [Thermodesulfovibrionales bacterium]|nr:hypothetical protein [Thermodesulfovibrionales bacterium]